MTIPTKLIVLAVALGLLVVGLESLPAWLQHPLGYCPASLGHRGQIECESYNFWSGISGSFITNTPNWLIAGGLLWFHHNCHTHGCWGWARRGKTLCKRCERDAA